MTYTPGQGFGGDGLRVQFNNGTGRQRNMFTRALQVCDFPFNRLDTFVEVSWVADPNPDVNNEWATTTYRSFDVCGRGAAMATIKLKPNLDDPNHEPVGGERFFQEVVIHEIGHIIGGKLLDDERSLMCAAFGGTDNDWEGSQRIPTPGYSETDSPEQRALYITDDGVYQNSTPWEDRLKEGFAETFKDVFLRPNERVWDNRTNWRLPFEAYSTYLRLIDNIGCPCFIV